MPRQKLQESKPTFVRLPIPLLDKCIQIAKEEYWNLSDVIREAVKVYLKDKEQKSSKEEK